jgi:hypothetical protein
VGNLLVHEFVIERVGGTVMRYRSDKGVGISFWEPVLGAYI